MCSKTILRTLIGLSSNQRAHWHFCQTKCAFANLGKVQLSPCIVSADRTGKSTLSYTNAVLLLDCTKPMTWAQLDNFCQHQEYLASRVRAWDKISLDIDILACNDGKCWQSVLSRLPMHWYECAGIAHFIGNLHGKDG